MKFFAPLVVGVIAFISSQVDANGVCYDPNHGTGMDASSVQADMQTIASNGFDSVRTFISKFGNTEMGPIIAAAGLKAMLGVPYPQSDYQDQMAAAIKAAQAGGVYAIMVGNENLAGAESVPSDMISVIQQIKSQVPSGVLVGTVQRNTEVINYQTVSGWQELVSACDLLGVNAHPYFTPGTTADTAIQVLNNQWQTMVGTFGSKLILTETGWPSSGTLSGNVGSVAGAEMFYNAYQQWSSSMGEKFYFQMFDTPYRSEEFEKTFGVVTSDAQNKFSISAQVSVSVSIGQQQQQQTTEAPTYQQTQTTDAPSYEQQTPVTEAPTAAPTPEPPTEVPTEDPTAAPTPEATLAPTPVPTEAPTAAPTPEATLAPTPVPTETPAIYQNSGSADYNTTSGSDEFVGSVSGSVSSSGDEAGVPSGSSASTESSKSSELSGNDNEQKQTKTGETEQQSEEMTQQQTTQGATKTGTSSQTQQQDDTQQANTQSGGSGASTTVAFALAGGACAALVAFGFIYQARKRAAELECAEDKDNGFAVTPIQNHCVL